jgi:tRNA dimethylallyltransferase
VNPEDARGPLVVVAGPTAAGKSALALALAQAHGGVIVSADSRQVYREFDIGTGKPTVAERAAVPHDLVDVADPTETYTAACFARDARSAIASAHASGRLPFLVGGTGFYIRALVGGTAIPEVAPDPERRAWLMAQPDLKARLTAVDSESAARLHENDRFRLARALEVVEATGKPLSAFAPVPPPYRVAYLVAWAELPDLEGRIARRVAGMLEAGWEAEIAGIVARHGEDLPLLGTLGYAELLDLRRGACSREDAVSLIVRNTRRYARRQLQWFRSERAAFWLDPSAHGNLKAWIDAAEREIAKVL